MEINDFKNQPINLEIIKDINKQLDVVVKQGHTHEGRFYIVVDPKTFDISLTPIKSMASSMKEVAQWMDQVSQKILQNPERLNRADLVKLQHNFQELTKLYQTKERGFFTNIAYKVYNLLTSTNKLMIESGAKLKSIKTAIKEEEAKPEKDYGKVEKFRKLIKNIDEEVVIKREDFQTQDAVVDSSIEYADSQGHVRAKKRYEISKTNQLEKIQADEDLDFDTLLKATQVEFDKEFKNSVPPARMVNRSVSNMFKLSSGLVKGLLYDVLDEVSRDVESNQLNREEALQKFKTLIKTDILDKNHETLEVDRSTFRDLVGSLVKDGNTGMGPIETIDLDSPQVEKLVKDYNDDSWVEGEERPLEYTLMDDKMIGEVDTALNNLFNSPSFNEAVLNYFHQIQPES